MEIRMLTQNERLLRTRSNMHMIFFKLHEHIWSNLFEDFKHSFVKGLVVHWIQTHTPRHIIVWLINWPCRSQRNCVENSLCDAASLKSKMTNWKFVLWSSLNIKPFESMQTWGESYCLAKVGIAIAMTLWQDLKHIIRLLEWNLIIHILDIFDGSNRCDFK